MSVEAFADAKFAYSEWNCEGNADFSIDLEDIVVKLKKVPMRVCMENNTFVFFLPLKELKNYTSSDRSLTISAKINAERVHGVKRVLEFKVPNFKKITSADTYRWTTKKIESSPTTQETKWWLRLNVEDIHYSLSPVLNCCIRATDDQMSECIAFAMVVPTTDQHQRRMMDAGDEIFQNIASYYSFSSYSAHENLGRIKDIVNSALNPDGSVIIRVLICPRGCP